MDLSKSFDFGMGYVALSRVRSFNGIKLIGVNDLSFKVNQEVIEIDKELRKMSEEAENELKKLSAVQKKKKQQEFVDKNADENYRKGISVADIPF